ncbi:MAG: phosphotransferase family protein [Actinobacteria bacterium]|nr:phosphotransferase family protein [Actinomycetota bacterium]
MPIPEQRDFEATRKVLAEWLRDKVGEVQVSQLVIPDGTGYSNETLLFDAGSGGGTAASYVLRVKPTGYQLFLETDFERQFEMMKLVAETTSVPMPQMLWFETDAAWLGAPFFVMSKVDGRIPSDNPCYNIEGFLFDATVDQRRQLWESALHAFTALHREVPAERIAFLAKPERGDTGFDQQWSYWSDSFEWAAQGREQPVADAALAWLVANMPSDRPTAFSWGDARPGNMIFDDFKCRAVLDWEMVSLGGPLADLGWWLFLDRFHSEGYGVARLEGLGTREETLAIWEDRVGPTAGVEWYEIYAGFKFAVIMIKLSQLFEHWEMMPAVDARAMERDNPVTAVLSAMLAERVSRTHRSRS